MGDFLLSAIRVLQDELEPDAFLKDVLDEIIKKKTSPNHSPSHMDSSDFQTKTLTELKTRIQSTSDTEGSESEADVKDDLKATIILPPPLPSGIPRLPNSTLSQARRVSLNDSEYSGVLPEHDKNVIFSRTLLMEQLGGGPISLQVHIKPGREKPLARRLGLSTFMCPNFDYNPWAPPSPGKNGFMFVGLGLEKDAFLISETHEVFVQFARKQMFYAGRYRCSKVEDLSPEEWSMLETKFRRKYSETTKSKAKDSRSADEIMTAYSEGSLRAPCVFLKCIDYNWELYHSLSRAPRSVNVSSSHRSSMPGTSQSPPKRKRLPGSEHSGSEGG